MLANLPGFPRGRSVRIRRARCCTFPLPGIGVMIPYCVFCACEGQVKRVPTQVSATLVDIPLTVTGCNVHSKCGMPMIPIPDDARTSLPRATFNDRHDVMLLPPFGTIPESTDLTGCGELFRDGFTATTAVVDGTESVLVPLQPDYNRAVDVGAVYNVSKTETHRQITFPSAAIGYILIPECFRCTGKLRMRYCIDSYECKLSVSHDHLLAHDHGVDTLGRVRIRFCDSSGVVYRWDWTIAVLTGVSRNVAVYILSEPSYTAKTRVPTGFGTLTIDVAPLLPDVNAVWWPDGIDTRQMERTNTDWITTATTNKPTLTAVNTNRRRSRDDDDDDDDRRPAKRQRQQELARANEQDGIPADELIDLDYTDDKSRESSPLGSSPLSSPTAVRSDGSDDGTAAASPTPQSLPTTVVVVANDTAATAHDPSNSIGPDRRSPVPATPVPSDSAHNTCDASDDDDDSDLFDYCRASVAAVDTMVQPMPTEPTNAPSSTDKPMELDDDDDDDNPWL